MLRDETDHKIEDCPKKKTSINNIQTAKEDDFCKNVIYNIISSGTLVDYFKNPNRYGKSNKFY